MGRPKGTDSAFQAAYSFVKANPHTRVIEVVRATGVSDRVVRKARQKLREEGYIRPYAANPIRPIDRTKLNAPEPRTFSDSPMTAEELHKEISQKIRAARNSDEFRPLAESLLKMLPKPETSDDLLGAGDPLTDEEMVERGSLMLRALGPDASLRAVELARVDLSEGIQSSSPDEPKEPDVHHPDPV